MTEDDDAYTTIPRVIAHGGDVEKVHLPEQGPPWSFPDDLDTLRAAISATHARVVILDPLQQFVPSITTQKGRQTLGELKVVAEEMGVAIIFLHHFVKASRSCKRVADAVGGGYGVYGMARSVLVLGWKPQEFTVARLIRELLDGAEADTSEPEDDDEPAGERIVIAHEKHSYGPEHPSIMYARELRPHPAAPDDPSQSVAVLVEVKQVKYNALQVMHVLAPDETLGEADQQSPRERAKQVILSILAMVTDGGMRATELEARAVAQGFSKVTVQRARKQLCDEGMIEKFRPRMRAARRSAGGGPWSCPTRQTTN